MGTGDLQGRFTDEEQPADVPHPWYEPESGLVEQPWIVSSTDLLIAWNPDPPVTGAPHAANWDQYFHPPAIPPKSEEDQILEPWDHDAAHSAVECLYHFVQSLEATNVDEAMTFISSNYHSFEQDRELARVIDRAALRLRLDQMLDTWRGPEFRLSLAEIPAPAFHPAGILIHITLQADHRDKHSGQLRSTVLPYLVWFTEERIGVWRIRSMTAVD